VSALAWGLHRLRAMSIGPVASASPDAPEALGPDPTRWVVQRGDTLGAIARQLQDQGMPGTAAELIRTLARLNGIGDPDRIEVGQMLTLPSVPEPERAPEDRVTRAEPSGVPSRGGTLAAAERGTLLQGALLRLTRGQTAAVLPGAHRAPDGTPLFRQGDPAWRAERLGASGEGPTLAHAGCAVTACAMALSRMGDTVLTPDALVRHLRTSGGFKGPLLDWSAAGAAVPGGPHACPGELDCARLDRELDAGRPVLLRVVHDVQGHSQQHWICLTGRDPRTGQYTANDPATGRTTVLAGREGALSSAGGDPVQYASDGRMVTFEPATARQA
jgi:LysM domain/Peptidase_C39 like family